MTKIPTVHIGLIGTGFMGKGHSLAFHKVGRLFDPPPARPHLAVVADVTEELARRAARAWGFDRWTTRWEEVVADEAVDLVDIATPNHLHKPIALAAARAGKHIYCEKPLAPTAQDARTMVEAAEAAGVKTMVGFNFLKNPAVLLAKEMITAGELGKLYHFSGGFRQDVLADPGQPFSWRFERERAGAGALGDLGAHVIACARFLVGEIKRVCGLTKTFIPERPVARGVGSSYEVQAAPDAPKRRVENEDCAHLLLEFANGTTGVLEASRIATGRKVHLTFEIHGSRGALYFVHERMNELKVYFTSDPPGRRGFRTVLLGPEHPYYRAFWPVAGAGLGFEDTKVIEVYELLDGIVHDKPLYPDFREGWEICRVIDAALRSAQEGRWVRVDEV